MKYMHLLIVFACLLVLTSCNQPQQVKESQLALMKTTNPTPEVTENNKSHERVKEIEQEVSKIPEIYDVAVVKGKEETLVVYKVKHMQRFRMKGIEKNVNKKLEEKYPKENFIVSSDYKIFLEAIRLNEQMNSSEFSRKKAEKRLKDIVKMTTDMK
ncbi:MAG: YhcN/YlaJ family sporulation lipoprotein [Bacillus sp. (in: Bacteria)]|nr:YhcN/YlaJ family sporulation lipoprotein [Bacillus sp. (in: firmicutes)]